LCASHIPSVADNLGKRLVAVEMKVRTVLL
jgi:hypothetical protein